MFIWLIYPKSLRQRLLSRRFLMPTRPARSLSQLHLCMRLSPYVTFFLSVLLILKANKIVNSSANIKPHHSKYTYYIHQTAYLQPSSMPSCNTYSLQPNEILASHKGRVRWLDCSGWASRVPSYLTLARRPYFIQHQIQ